MYLININNRVSDGPSVNIVAVIGGVAGAVFIVTIIITVVICCLRNDREKNAKKREEREDFSNNLIMSQEGAHELTRAAAPETHTNPPVEYRSERDGSAQITNQSLNYQNRPSDMYLTQTAKPEESDGDPNSEAQYNYIEPVQIPGRYSRPRPALHTNPPPLPPLRPAEDGYEVPQNLTGQAGGHGAYDRLNSQRTTRGERDTTSACVYDDAFSMDHSVKS